MGRLGRRISDISLHRLLNSRTPNQPLCVKAVQRTGGNMKSIFRIAAASLTLAALAAVSAPVFAGPARAEFSVGTGYYSRQDYIPSQLTYEAPAPVYRYQDADGWRQQQWRENAW